MISDTENKELVFGPKTSTKKIFTLDKKTNVYLKFDELKSLVVTSVEEKEITIKVFTDLNEDVENLINFKVDVSRWLDIFVTHKRGKKTPTSHLHVVLSLPKTFLYDLELEGKTNSLTMYHCIHAHTEFNGNVDKVLLFDLCGDLELDSNSKMEITYDGSLTKLDINQINSSTNLMLAKGANTYIYTANKSCDLVLIGCVNNVNSAHFIELNGKNSHLIARNE